MTDVGQYTGASTDEQHHVLNMLVNEETSDPLASKPKEEQIEHDISSEQQPRLWGTDNAIPPDCVKSDPEEEEDINMPHITNSFHIQVVDCSFDSPAAHLAENVNCEHNDGSTVDLYTATESLRLCSSKEKSLEPQKQKNTSKKKVKLIKFFIIAKEYVL